jgi:hypothetical protein
VKHHTVLLLLVISAASGFAYDHPRLTRAEVIRMANLEARRHGYDLRAYERPDAHFNYVEKDNTWVIFYEGKAVNGMTTVGNHFTVHIDDRTKEIWLIPGR